MSVPDSANAVNLEALIISESATVASEMSRIAAMAHSEEDVRHECNKLIDSFIDKAMLKVKGRHEYEIDGGFLDSKYSGVLLEYKYPKGQGKIGPASDSPGTKKVVEQLQNRFVAFQLKEHQPFEKLLGVGLDSVRIVFVRRRGEDWDIEEPQPITKYSVERILRAIVSLGAQGFSFTPSQLAAHFGSASTLAQEGIRKLYLTQSSTSSKKTKIFFAQWKILFGEVCGYDLGKSNEKLRKLAHHYSLEDAKPAELLFAVHTFYAIFMKFLAAQIATSVNTIVTSVLKKCIAAPSSAKLKKEMYALEKGGIWAELGIKNFLEGDIFSWYLSSWNDDVAGVVRDIVRRLDEYDPRTLSVDPSDSRDLLKQLYQHLFPKSVRHDLGEYYTPDWLADEVLDAVKYDGNPDHRLLDPACGSGTFLVLAINRIKQWFDEHRHTCGFDESELVTRILRNIVGFDLNPLAVMAARTNFLLAIRDLLKFAAGIEIPVYLCDSILVPVEYGDLFTRAEVGKVKRLPTAVGDFRIPNEIAKDPDSVAKYAETIELCLPKCTGDEFVEQCVAEGLAITEHQLHIELFSRLQQLDKSDENGIWALIIKNSFAPLFTKPVDFIVGNPPWVNWENLPDGYRDDTAYIWEHYKLTGTESKGKRQASEKAKTDVAFLMTYVATDAYLKSHGKLGFVITQTGFQSELGGRAFRRFALPDDTPLGIVAVEDMVRVHPFGREAANRTAVLIVHRGTPLTWPLPYIVWERRSSSRLDSDESLADFRKKTTRVDWVGYPVNTHDSLSSWIVGRDVPVSIARKFVGPSDYRNIVREGVNTRGANGIFYVEQVGDGDENRILMRNIPSAGRKRVPQETAKVDKEHVYPLLMGKDVRRWTASPSMRILLPHSPLSPTDPIPESSLRKHDKATYKFLSKFETVLRRRRKFRNFDPSSGAFYGLYNVGTYTFSPYKVVWREIATDFMVAPVFPVGSGNGSERTVVPNHKLMMVPVKSKNEALYLAAMLNATISRYTVLSYTVATQISTHVLNNVNVPQYDETNKLHKSIAALGSRAVLAANSESSETLNSVEVEIDEVTRPLWGATSEQVTILRSALSEIIEVLSQEAEDEDEDHEDEGEEQPLAEP
jgi:Eco57I restriction-modification methylase